jgi:hypothetical protein
MTGVTGEFFVAAELSKRGLHAAPTLGNAKDVDLLAFNPETGRHFAVKVKAKRDSKGTFWLAHTEVSRTNTYVFVLVNGPDEAVQYCIVRGGVLADEPERFGELFTAEKAPGVHWKYLVREGFEGDWSVFGEVVA